MAENNKLVKSLALVLALAGRLAVAAAPFLVAQQAGPDGAKPARLPNTRLAVNSRRVLASRPLAMYYYAGDTRGLESIQSHASEMTLAAPQCYWVEKDGVVRGELPPRLAEIAQRARLPLMPLIYNKGFDRESVTRLLRNPRAQRRAVSYMGYLAASNNYAGFQIDLENIDPADQNHFSHFVRLAAARLHRDGRLLSVAVVPRFSDARPGDGRTGEPSTGEWSAAFDYRALGRTADFLTLMTYDHSGRASPAGPVAGYEWVKTALDYAVARVPREKLLLGIPLYGREWLNTSDGTTTRSTTSQDVRALLSRPDVQAQWDERWRSPWLEIREAGTVRTVWYEDSRSWSEKLGLISEYRLRGFAAWRIGFEGPEYWVLSEVESAGASKTAKTSERPAESRKSKGGANSAQPTKEGPTSATSQ